MMTPYRIVPRSVFLTGTRRLGPISFATSSVTKFLQARHAFELSGLTLVQNKPHKEPYAESYEAGPEALLQRAIDQVRNRRGSASVFFVEDTSVRIEALSDVDKDVPGLAVKEWFQQTSFLELDAALRARGNDRRAVVTSRIALSLPGLDRPILLEASSIGFVADSSPNFVANPLYPWLNSEDFSAWFIPDGADRRLGEMSVDESYQYDHRSQCLFKLVDRLEEYATTLNFASHSIRIASAANRRQATLFPNAKVLADVVVCGLMCSGKSTAAEWLSMGREFRRIEASAYLEAASQELGLVESDSRAALARSLFAEAGHDAVERYIARYAINSVDAPIVYSGPRTIEGLWHIVNHLNRPIVVAVVADDRLRFERCLQRSRGGDPLEWAAFQARDSVDLQFGLLGYVRDVADVVITNDRDAPRMIQRLDEIVGGWRDRAKPRVTRKYLILSALQAEGGMATVEQLCAKVNRNFGSPLTHQALVRLIMPGAHLDRTETVIELTPWGEAYLGLVDRRCRLSAEGVRGPKTSVRSGYLG